MTKKTKKQLDIKSKMLLKKTIGIRDLMTFGRSKQESIIRLSIPNKKLS